MEVLKIGCRARTGPAGHRYIPGGPVAIAHYSNIIPISSINVFVKTPGQTKFPGVVW